MSSSDNRYVPEPKRSFANKVAIGAAATGVGITGYRAYGELSDGTLSILRRHWKTATSPGGGHPGPVGNVFMTDPQKLNPLVRLGEQKAVVQQISEMLTSQPNASNIINSLLEKQGWGFQLSGTAAGQQADILYQQGITHSGLGGQISSLIKMGDLSRFVPSTRTFPDAAGLSATNITPLLRGGTIDLGGQSIQGGQGLVKYLQGQGVVDANDIVTQLQRARQADRKLQLSILSNPVTNRPIQVGFKLPSIGAGYNQFKGIPLTFKDNVLYEGNRVLNAFFYGDVAALGEGQLKGTSFTSGTLRDFIGEFDNFRQGLTVGVDDPISAPMRAMAGNEEFVGQPYNARTFRRYLMGMVSDDHSMNTGLGGINRGVAGDIAAHRYRFDAYGIKSREEVAESIRTYAELSENIGVLSQNPNALYDNILTSPSINGVTMYATEGGYAEGRVQEIRGQYNLKGFAPKGRRNKLWGGAYKAITGTGGGLSFDAIMRDPVLSAARFHESQKYGAQTWAGKTYHVDQGLLGEVLKGRHTRIPFSIAHKEQVMMHPALAEGLGGVQAAYRSTLSVDPNDPVNIANQFLDPFESFVKKRHANKARLLSKGNQVFSAALAQSGNGGLTGEMQEFLGILSDNSKRLRLSEELGVPLPANTFRPGDIMGNRGGQTKRLKARFGGPERVSLTGINFNPVTGTMNLGYESVGGTGSAGSLMTPGGHTRSTLGKLSRMFTGRQFEGTVMDLALSRTFLSNVSGSDVVGGATVSNFGELQKALGTSHSPETLFHMMKHTYKRKDWWETQMAHGYYGRHRVGEGDLEKMSALFGRIATSSVFNNKRIAREAIGTMFVMAEPAKYTGVTATTPGVPSTRASHHYVSHLAREIEWEKRLMGNLSRRQHMKLARQMRSAGYDMMKADGTTIKNIAATSAQDLRNAQYVLDYNRLKQSYGSREFEINTMLGRQLKGIASGLGINVPEFIGVDKTSVGYYGADIAQLQLAPPTVATGAGFTTKVTPDILRGLRNKGMTTVADTMEKYADPSHALEAAEMLRMVEQIEGKKVSGTHKIPFSKFDQMGLAVGKGEEAAALGILDPGGPAGKRTRYEALAGRLGLDKVPKNVAVDLENYPHKLNIDTIPIPNTLDPNYTRRMFGALDVGDTLSLNRGDSLTALLLRELSEAAGDVGETGAARAQEAVTRYTSTLAKLTHAATMASGSPESPITRVFTARYAMDALTKEQAMEAVDNMGELKAFDQLQEYLPEKKLKPILAELVLGGKSVGGGGGAISHRAGEEMIDELGRLGEIKDVPGAQAAWRKGEGMAGWVMRDPAASSVSIDPIMVRNLGFYHARQGRTEKMGIAGDIGQKLSDELVSGGLTRYAADKKVSRLLGRDAEATLVFLSTSFVKTLQYDVDADIVKIAFFGHDPMQSAAVRDVYKFVGVTDEAVLKSPTARRRAYEAGAGEHFAKQGGYAEAYKTQRVVRAIDWLEEGVGPTLRAQVTAKQMQKGMAGISHNAWLPLMYMADVNPEKYSKSLQGFLMSGHEGILGGVGKESSIAAEAEQKANDMFKKINAGAYTDTGGRERFKAEYGAYRDLVTPGGRDADYQSQMDEVADLVSNAHKSKDYHIMKDMIALKKAKKVDTELLNKMRGYVQEAPQTSLIPKLLRDIMYSKPGGKWGYQKMMLQDTGRRTIAEAMGAVRKHKTPAAIGIGVALGISMLSANTGGGDIRDEDMAAAEVANQRGGAPMPQVDNREYNRGYIMDQSSSNYKYKAYGRGTDSVDHAGIGGDIGQMGMGGEISVKDNRHNYSETEVYNRMKQGRL